ncbi:MAG: hypothetical protein IRZ16_04715 [Myxococcaceae bacterium]|nr:hypothetical protein [Myxococcaceae bacterium]
MYDRSPIDIDVDGGMSPDAGPVADGGMPDDGHGHDGSCHEGGTCEQDKRDDHDRCESCESCHPLDLIRFWVADRFKFDNHKPVPYSPKYDVELLAKAQPDECFNGIGQPIGHPPCTGAFPDSGQPKTNDAYVWGQVNTGDAVWFGTISNTHCLVEAGFLGVNTPQSTSKWVCEFNASTSGTGDFRPPNLYRYDLATNTLEMKNPPAATPAGILRTLTLGLRSAGAAGGVVFIAGPGVPGLNGINVFAFDQASGNLLGAVNLQQWDDIRSWVTVNGALYAAVKNADVPNAQAPGGSILRWVGQNSTDPNVLFQFEVVGETREEAANLASDGRRLFVTGWPVTQGGQTRLAGLWRSPELLGGVLTSAAAPFWKQLWRIDDYDPDPVAAAVTGMGDLEAFDGRLYFGTMNVPFVGTDVALELHREGVIDLDCNRDGQLGPEEILATALGTHRSISLFAIPLDSDSKEDVTLLYGERFLPRYVAQYRRYAVAPIDLFQNRLPQSNPVWGASGLGNFFNAYTWAMEVQKGELFVGTFDWSQLARVALLDPVTTLNTTRATAATLTLDSLGSTILPREGADLFRISKRAQGAIAESLSGLGNDTNYGVRTLTKEGDNLYVGTANPMNLDPDGGWELLRLNCGVPGLTDTGL